ncbi:hypothetical protein KAR91_45135 [Candidatus Pacearchaeota archaeon]|nr:hypothetical protein [Candidatus Pacearchaeota archaeon]
MANQLASITNTLVDTTAVSQYSYPVYDNVGNRKQLDRTFGANPTETTLYDYNNIYELTAVTGEQNNDYSYDAVGNRLTADATLYTPNNLNQYTDVGGVAINSDPDGNVITDGTDTYTYDADNRLSSVNSLQSSVYTYDPFDRRVGKVVDGAETYFIYDGDMVVAEVDATGALLSEYVNTNNIDEVLTMDRGGVTYYYHYDGLGSVTEVTDSAGTIVENYTYDPYGNPSVTNSLIENPYMFTGRRWDEESTLYHYRARAYDPTNGRFL